MLVKSLSLCYKEASLRHALWPVLMRDFPWIMSITAPKDLGYLEDCSVLEMDHLLVKKLQYKKHLAELFFFFFLSKKYFGISNFTLPDYLNASAPIKMLGKNMRSLKSLCFPHQSRNLWSYHNQD